ncbi:MAG TPA: signal peptide peptidase SppA [Xanthomonadales bacterium]|nr:signal peptide peptidase SppA [Xanthomonadales bacterium]
MTEKRPNFLVRLVRGAYRALDASRRFAMNLLFLLIVLLVLAAIAGNTPRMLPQTALVLAPKGPIVEQYSASPGDRALAKMFGDDRHELQLRDVLRALDAAADDPMIERVVIVPDLVTGTGHATLREIGAALERFKRSGKEVVAYADGMDQRGYYLAAHADRVYLHPEGAVLLEGLSRYRTYFKDAFDKFGVEARLFRVGEYKSAGETYVRSDQSPEAREADLYWMGDVWQRYLADIARLRSLDAAALSASLDALDSEITARGGDLAKLALDQKLVDELKTRDELRAILIAAGAKDDDDEETFRQIGIERYSIVAAARALKLGAPQVAVVVAEGEIVDGDQPPGMVGGDSTARLIRRAREDDDVKAVVLRVDSPGGGVFPSEVIRREIELTRAAGKPVVASMGDLAASGGYWISMNADEIVASESTITGSIGIFGLWFNVPQAMGKLGLRTDGVGTNWISGAIDPTRAYDPRLGTVIQSVIDRGYADFIGKVAAARGKTPDEVDTIARGRVWSGEQAKARGLVDTLGTFEQAVASAAKRAGLDEDGYQVRYVEKELTGFEQFMLDLTSSRLAAMVGGSGLSLPASFLPEARIDELASLRAFVRDAMKQRPGAIYAHCECSI